MQDYRCDISHIETKLYMGSGIPSILGLCIFIFLNNFSIHHSQPNYILENKNRTKIKNSCTFSNNHKKF